MRRVLRSGVPRRQVLQIVGTVVVLGAILIALLRPAGGATPSHHAVAVTPATSSGQPVASQPTPSAPVPWTARLVNGASTAPSSAQSAARAFLLTYTAFIRHTIPVSAIRHVSPDLRSRLAKFRGVSLAGAPAVIVRLRVLRRGSVADVVAEMRSGPIPFGVEALMRRRAGSWVAYSIPSARGSR